MLLSVVTIEPDVGVAAMRETSPATVFAVDRKHEGEGKLMAVSLKAGDVRLLIGQDDGARGWDRVKGEGISLQLTTAQNIDELARRVRERGGTLESGPADVMGARMFRLLDPDGFKLVISAERS